MWIVFETMSLVNEPLFLYFYSLEDKETAKKILEIDIAQPYH